MISGRKYIIIFLISICSVSAFSQKDCTVPLPPVLTSVSIEYETNTATLNWILSPDPGIAAYIIYSYSIDQGGRGDPIDTLWDPAATSFSYTSNAFKYFSTSYVVTALKLPRCESPFSNVLSTIFTEANIDTCNKKIEIKWNSYISSPYEVTGYSVFYKLNGGALEEAAQIAQDKNNYILTDFITDSEYCFVVRADLEGGNFSTSNKVCLQTKMERPPQWINADSLTIMPDKSLLITFTIDPSSEIKTINLERKTGTSGTFSWIAKETALSGPFLFIDNEADINKINYYRAYAQNNCGVPVAYSNNASNIVLKAEVRENEIILKWNPYRQWNGIISSQKIFVSTGGNFSERYSVLTGDSIFTLSYSDLMYETTGSEICFRVKVEESFNPYGIRGISYSSVYCIPAIEMVTVPNIFTPDNNLVNDLFRPVLSFTPKSYSLIITDLQRRTLFKTVDYTEEWDGTKNGSPLPEGVYLWFLETGTPSGRKISKTGTITITYNH